MFSARLVLPEPVAGWIVLSYRGPPGTPRPVLQARGAQGVLATFILPGLSAARALWLGLLPAGTRELRLAASPGLVLDRVGRRSAAGVLAECALRRPLNAVGALYAGLRGNRRRARDLLRGGCAVTRPAGYATWAAARTAPPAERASAGPGDIDVLVPVRLGEADALARTLASLDGQTLRPASVRLLWEAGPPPDRAADGRVHLAWQPEQPLGALLGAAGTLGLLEPGDTLDPEALALLAAPAREAGLAYADAIGPDGLPRLKPAWSPDLALATGYLGRPQLVARDRLHDLVGEPCGPIADFALRFDLAASLGPGARRVPRVLAHCARAQPTVIARAAILAARLPAAGIPARPAIHGAVLDLAWPLPEPAPLASIVIPSRDRLDLIARACRGVLRETAYPAIELIIVDNGSADPAVLTHYETLARDPRVRILPRPGPFNFSRLVNDGVAASTGRVVVLLNNDVAVLEPDWLAAMVAQACRPEVGAVGAKLLYGDGRLQHAGVVVGLGGRAGHILRRRPADTPGRLGRMTVAHEVSAVTAACLAVERGKYDAVGGFDAEAFPVDFNDVDFCLRLGAAGYRTVWTPHARLAHLESVSRGPTVGPARARFEAEAARFTARWLPVIRDDPFYHPALSLTTFGEDLE